MSLKFSIDVLSKSNRNSLGREINITVFRIMRFMDLERYLGRGAHGVIYECGRELGESLNPSTIDDVVNFCEKHKIGKVEIINKSPLQIRVYECISCSGLPEVGEPLCWFEGGFIAGCLEKILNKKVRAKETHCAGLGDDFCQFEIKVL
ncbi:4-vinyl reductase 4VR [Methanocaldococcus lauensis]|nr:4-vinyl reductase 4VR [Methanocaldococcus lauensis]